MESEKEIIEQNNTNYDNLRKRSLTGDLFLRSLPNEMFIKLPGYRKLYWQVLACGIVRRICKGEDFDIVWINCYNGKGWKRARKFICKDRMARSQIYTLKVNQYVMVVAYQMAWKGNAKRWEYMCYVRSFFPSYVPNAYSKKKLLKENDYSEIENITPEDKKETENFLEDFRNNLVEENRRANENKNK